VIDNPNKVDDGGPAFPVFIVVSAPSDDNSVGESVDFTGLPRGLTVRDWFAGHALAGVLASQTTIEDAAKTALPGETGAMWAARASYNLADAMLAERAKVRS